MENSNQKDYEHPWKYWAQPDKSNSKRKERFGVTSAQPELRSHAIAAEWYKPESFQRKLNHNAAIDMGNSSVRLET